MNQLQIAFNEVWTWFTKPGVKLGRQDNVADIPTCLYSDESGDVRCAVGCRLPMEWLNLHGIREVNDIGGIYSLLDAFPEVSNIIGEKDSLLFDFHCALQNAHDGSDDVEHFLARLRGVATVFYLEVPSNVPSQELVTV